MTDALLRVDFEAALAKLAPSQLQGSWELPAELARRMIAAGAASLDFRLERSRLRLRAPGAQPEAVLLRSLAVLLDARRDAAERHAALVELEARDALAFAALAAVASRRLEIRASGLRLLAHRGAPPRLTATGDPLHASVELAGCQIDPRRAARHLERHGRFAPVSIVINDRKIARGFRNSLVRARVRRPLPAALAIAATGEAPRLWLLRHGILATRATVPGYPAFEAAVEMGTVSIPDRSCGAGSHLPRPAVAASGAALREAIQPFLEELIDAAMDLLAALGHQAEALSEEAQQRAGRLVLQAVGQGLRADRLRRVALFPVLGEHGPELVTLDELESLIELDAAQRRVLDVVDPQQPIAEVVLGSRRVAVLRASKRKLLGDLLDVRFRAPPHRPRPRRSTVRWLSELAGKAAFFWHAALGRHLEPAALTAHERTFLELLRRRAPACSAVFRRGDGRVRLAGGRLLLPRDAPLVRASTRAVSQDPSWLYPVLLGLLGGHEIPPPELRNAWRSPATDDPVAPTPQETLAAAPGA